MQNNYGIHVDNEVLTVSVIVPFFETEYEILQRLVHSIDSQTYPHEKIQLILIDNNKLPTNYKFEKLDIKLIQLHIEKPGSYTARNAGIKNAKTDVIAFTDADCIPSVDWLSNAIETLKESSDYKIVGGDIIITFKKPFNPTIIEDFDRRTHLRQDRYLSQGYTATANLVTWAAVFQEVGLFDENMLSGGDDLWCRVARSKGFQVEGCKLAIVYHEARNTLFGIIVKNRRACGKEFIVNKLYKSKYDCICYELKIISNRWKRLWDQKHKTLFFRKIGLSIVFLLIETTRIIEFLRLYHGTQMERR